MNRSQILELYNTGLTITQIANTTGLHYMTIKYHVNERERQRVNQAKIRRRRNMMRLLRDEAGNECVKCGYNKCVDALEFHHIKGKKIKNISSFSNLKDAQREIKKCLLLCANCHTEEHFMRP